MKTSLLVSLSFAALSLAAVCRSAAQASAALPSGPDTCVSGYV